MSCACEDTACVAATLPGPCVHEPTDANSVRVFGFAECVQASPALARSLLLLSRAAGGAPVCTGGDSFHVAVTSERMRFTALSQPTQTTGVYHVNLSASAIISGRHRLELVISLVETQQRGRARGPTDDPWSLAQWLHVSRCAWQRVPLEQPVIDIVNPDAHSAEPRCGASGSGGGGSGSGSTFEPLDMVYSALDADEGCERARLCTGDAAARLLNTSNEQRLRQRTRRGFRHVMLYYTCPSSDDASARRAHSHADDEPKFTLPRMCRHVMKPRGCALHLYDEHEVASCLHRLKVLNVGSDVAVNVQVPADCCSSLLFPSESI